MPNPKTIKKYNKEIQEEANETPAQTLTSVSMRLDLYETWEYGLDQLPDSFVLEEITMNDIKEFLNELKKLESYRYSDYAHKTRKIRCWNAFGWSLLLYVSIIVLSSMVLYKEPNLIVFVAMIPFFLLPWCFLRASMKFVHHVTMKKRKIHFFAVVAKFRKKLINAKLDIIYSPTYAWFQFIDNRKFYLIDPNEILVNEIWGDCNVSYSGKS